MIFFTDRGPGSSFPHILSAADIDVKKHDDHTENRLLQNRVLVLEKSNVQLRERLEQSDRRMVNINKAVDQLIKDNPTLKGQVAQIRRELDSPSIDWYKVSGLMLRAVPVLSHVAMMF